MTVEFLHIVFGVVVAGIVVVLAGINQLQKYAAVLAQNQLVLFCRLVLLQTYLERGLTSQEKREIGSKAEAYLAQSPAVEE